MAHTHYIKIIAEVGKIADDAPHQEITLVQRTDSSENTIRMQQALIDAVNNTMKGFGDANIEAKAGNSKDDLPPGAIR